MNDAQAHKKLHTEHEATLRYMFKLAGPVVITTITFTIMQFIDRLMVAQLGREALAAVLPAGFMAFVPGTFAIGVTTAVTTYVSQSLGAGRKWECSSYCWQSIYMGVIYFLVITAILWPAAPFILGKLAPSPEVAKLEVIYFRILLLAQTVGILMWCSSQFYIGIHRPMITMWTAIIGQIINVFANYVLIFGKLGLPAMGIAGAGWGTFCGMAVISIIRMIVFLSDRIHIEYQSRWSMALDKSKMLDLLKVGIPAGFELMTNVALWGVILTSLVATFGEAASAATSAVFSTTHVSVMPVVGMKIALSSAVGKSIGQGRKDIAIRQTWQVLKVALLYMGIVGLAFFIFREQIMTILAKGQPKVMDIGANLLICAAVYQVFHATRIAYSGALRGAGDTLWLAGIAAFGTLVVMGGGGMIAVLAFSSYGALGPWIAATLSIMTVAMLNRQRFKSNQWMQIDLIGAKNMELLSEDQT